MRFGRRGRIMDLRWWWQAPKKRVCGTLIGFESSASDERLMVRHWDGYGLVWRIVVVVIGFDGLGFDFCGRTQHPFFFFYLQLIFVGNNVYKFSCVLMIWVHLLMFLWFGFIFLFIFIQWFKIKENVLILKSGFVFLLFLFKALLDLNSCDFLFLFS